MRKVGTGMHEVDKGRNQNAIRSYIVSYKLVSDLLGVIAIKAT